MGKNRVSFLEISLMSALRKIKAFAESKINRDALGRFAPKDSTGATRLVRVAHFVAANHVPGGLATAKIGKIAGNFMAKKLAGENPSIKKEVADAGAELTGSQIGQFVGHLAGGKAGGVVGSLLGYVAADGIKHVKKVALEEKAKLARDDIFQAASDHEKAKMTGNAIAQGLKRTAKEHRQDLKNTVISWASENIAGVLNNDIITNISAEYVNPTDAKRAAKGVLKKLRRNND